MQSPSDIPLLMNCAVCTYVSEYLKCGYSLCQKFINSWLKTNPKCPNCENTIRLQVHEDLVVFLQNLSEGSFQRETCKIIDGDSTWEPFDTSKDCKCPKESQLYCPKCFSKPIMKLHEEWHRAQENKYDNGIPDEVIFDITKTSPENLEFSVSEM